MNTKGIITGDVVASSEIPPGLREQLLPTIRRTVEELRAISPMEIEFFRGDSFQIIVDAPEKVLKIAVLLRAGLKSRTPGQDKLWDARISIGVGGISLRAEKIVESDGEAFQFSGRGLDEIGKHRLAIKTPWSHVNEELSVSTLFADDIVTGWTQAQAEVVYLSLLHDTTQKEVASLMGKSAQNVNKLLSTARESLVRAYLERYETLVTREVKG